MNRIITALIGASCMVAAVPASAATFVPGDPQFQVSGDISSGPIFAFLGNAISAVGNFSDSFIFRIDQNGTGSGSITTSTAQVFSSTDLDLTSVLVNGFAATKTTAANGTETFSITGVPISFGETNSIVVNGYSRGAGSYGGNATFLPVGVPEPASWAMMIGGVGLVGGMLRRRQRMNATVRFA